ncbi:hypothetical protein [Nocardioides renjunii]|uniref:hypothetical protein n=1 Tax=Nocardioides renjunii TaxID=3095075 RepID=UPI002AFF153C|nr:hypothetical protein [Nocardioides sp. S-34]WQQ20562.1 hypothetical protein SHK17_11670 [Nocardioides sp. S-34]
MSEDTQQDTQQPSADALDMFDDEAAREAGPALVCRVCGALVSPAGDYAQAHWDWHEASNGA